MSWLSHSWERHAAERLFSRLQLISAGAYSLGHGTNDAQKTMGIIAASLVASGKKNWTAGHFHFLWAKHDLAMWIILSCHAAMAIGTLLGGWRIGGPISAKRKALIICNQLSIPALFPLAFVFFPASKRCIPNASLWRNRQP
jgi:PiT family inorganic phosphate transporter